MIGFMLIVALCLTESVLAEEPTAKLKYETPQEVFFAYKTAKNNQDWATVFSLHTFSGQDALISEQLERISCWDRTLVDDKLRAIYKAHGVDLSQFQSRLTQLLSQEPSNEEEENEIIVQFNQLSSSTVESIESKSKLYDGVQAQISKILDRKKESVVELREMEINQNSAKGTCVGKFQILETIYDPAGGSYTRYREVTEYYPLHFRQIEGHWFLTSGEGK